VDPADQWVLDPVTGTYQLRPQGAYPAPPEPAPAAPPPPRPDDAVARQREPVSRRASSQHGRRRPAGPPNRRRSKPRQQRTALLWTAGAVGVALVAGGVGLLASGHTTGGAISTVDVGDAGAGTLSYSGPLNLLLLGAADGPSGRGGTADTTILLHVAADRGNATALSIPGDVVTSIPDCPTAQQGGGSKVVPGSPQKGASPKAAESLGADGRDPGCAMRLVRQLTGIQVDHFLMISSATVRTLSAATGDNAVCFAQLPARDTRLRTLDTAKALTVDTPLGSQGALDSLAAQIGKVDPKHITFTTLPTKSNPADPAHATVVVDQARAAQLFSLIKNDVSLSQGPVAPDPKLVGTKATPHNTRVTVLNGSGVFGASQDVLNWLQNQQGVNRSANGGDAPATLARTTLAYAPNQADQARSLAAMMGLPAAALHEGTKNAAPLAYMTLTLGKDFTAAGVPIGPPSAPPKGLRMVTADGATCAG
jgi:hypothetical protein